MSGCQVLSLTFSFQEAELQAPQHFALPGVENTEGSIIFSMNLVYDQVTCCVCLSLAKQTKLRGKVREFSSDVVNP